MVNFLAAFVYLAVMSFVNYSFSADKTDSQKNTSQENSIQSLVSKKERREWGKGKIDDLINRSGSNRTEGLTIYSSIPQMTSTYHHSATIEVKPIASCGTNMGDMLCSPQEQPVALHYFLYLPKNIQENLEKGIFPPVVFSIYAGGHPPESKFCELDDLILSLFGCIVVRIADEKWGEDTKIPTTHVNYTNFPEQLFKDVRQIYQYFTKFIPEGIKTPIITPEKTKVFLMGHSFGGYITMLAATDKSKVSQLFDGFIADAGIYNWATHIPESNIEDFDFTREKFSPHSNQRTFLFKKNYTKDKEYNEEISPIYHLKNLERPVLVIQGLEDRRVLPLQIMKLSEMARAEKKDKYLRTDYYAKKEHLLSNDSEERFDRLDRIMTFIEDVITQGNNLNQYFSPLNTMIKIYKESKAERAFWTDYIRKHDLASLHNFLSKVGSNEDIKHFLNEPINDYETPLFLAVSVSTPEIVKYLIDKGADPNLEFKGYTPLTIALIQSPVNPQMIKLLIEKGANIHKKNSKGQTPLEYAREEGKIEIADLMEQYAIN